MKKKQSVFFGIAALLTVAMFIFAGCDTGGIDPELSGVITISPSGATTGAQLTANYSGTETVTYQWNNGEGKRCLSPKRQIET
jgi:hypothetical protein